MCDDVFFLNQDLKGCTSYYDSNYPNCVTWYYNGDTYECIRCKDGFYYSVDNPTVNPC